MNPSSLSPAPDAVFDWPGASGPLQWRLFRGSPTRRSDALLVFFHPGGFISDDVEASDHCLRVLADTCRINVVAPNYALAPDHPFPAAVEDAHAVLRGAVKQRAQLGWNGTHLFVGGVEAGGNLAAVSALVCRDRLGPKLAGQILVMPMLDPSLQSDSMRAACVRAESVVKAVERSYRCYLPRPADRLHPYASPLQASRLAGLPPALVLTAEGDPLCDEACRYADKLEAAGVAVQRGWLHPAGVRDAQERCQATADDPGIQALAAFLAPYTCSTPSAATTPASSTESSPSHSTDASRSTP